MYQRFVCFKFKEDSPPDAVIQHMDMFAALKNTIPQIVSYAAGKTFAGGEGDEKFDTAHYVTFQSKDDIDRYFHHPAHQEFIVANRDHWEDVLVVDSEI
ncbi:MAG: Dabb family protein [Anaerolineales bacterium]